VTPNGSGAAVDFAEARLFAERAENLQQRQAARRVAEHAHNAGDCRELLSMLGLADLPPGSWDAPAQHTAHFSPDALDVLRSATGARA